MTSMGSHARVVLLLVFTFAAGTAAGVAADRLGLLPATRTAEPSGRGHREAGERSGSRPAESEDRREGRTTIERFADDLGLTAEQHAEIDEVLERYRRSMRSMWGEVRPRYRTLVDSVRTQIEAVLTPEQVTRYRELLRSQHSENGRRGDESRDGSTDDAEKR